jgi:hypothetical protein
MTGWSQKSTKVPQISKMFEREHPSRALNELVTRLNRGGNKLSERDARLLENPDTFLELVRQAWRVQGFWPIHGAKAKEGYKEDPIYLASEAVINKYSSQAREIVVGTLADEFGFNYSFLNAKFSSDEGNKNVTRMLLKGVPRALGSYSQGLVGHNFERRIFDGGMKTAVDMYAESRGQEVEDHYMSDRHS